MTDRKSDIAETRRLVANSSVGRAAAAVKVATRWAGKRPVLNDGLSTAPAPGPKGRTPVEDIEWARRQRRIREREEASKERRADGKVTP